MSIRKVSDLPFLEADKVDVSSVNESLLEVSYLSSKVMSSDDTIETRTYVSRALELCSFSQYILSDLMTGDNVIISGYKEYVDTISFYDGINVCSFINLSGDFLVNSDVYNPTTITYINNRTNTIVGTNQNVLSAPTIQMYANNVRFNSFTGSNKDIVVLSSDDTLHLKKSPIIEESITDIMKNPKKATTVGMFKDLSDYTIEISNDMRGEMNKLGNMASCWYVISSALPETLKPNTFYFIVES